MRRTFKAEPQAGVEWAKTIDDPELRERYLRIALRQLVSVDSPAGEAAIHETELSQLALDSLLRSQR